MLGALRRLPQQFHQLAGTHQRRFGTGRIKHHAVPPQLDLTGVAGNFHRHRKGDALAQMPGELATERSEILAHSRCRPLRGDLQ